MLSSLFSFRFLLDISMTLDFSSLKLILLFFDHADILLISRFDIFSAALMVSHLIANIKLFVYFRAVYCCNVRTITVCFPHY
jgi:hypothetical protein